MHNKRNEKQMSRKRADPRHAGDIISPGWPGNDSVAPRREEEGGMWVSADAPETQTQIGWMDELKNSAEGKGIYVQLNHMSTVINT